jgi:hypothetical protein
MKSSIFRKAFLIALLYPSTSLFSSISDYKWSIGCCSSLVTALVAGIYSYGCSQEENKILNAHFSDEVQELYRKLKERSYAHADDPIQTTYTLGGETVKPQHFIDWINFYKRLDDRELSKKLIKLNTQGTASGVVSVLAGMTFFWTLMHAIEELRR